MAAQGNYLLQPIQYFKLVLKLFQTVAINVYYSLSSYVESLIEFERKVKS